MKKPLVKSSVKVVKNDKMSGYKKGQNREGDQGPVSPFYLNPCFFVLCTIREEVVQY